MVVIETTASSDDQASSSLCWRDLSHSHTGIVYLARADQERLPFATTKFLSLGDDNFDQRNLGYLYAISQGATSIWDWDGTTTLPLADKTMDSDCRRYKLERQHHVLNPYPLLLNGTHKLKGSEDKVPAPSGFPGPFRNVKETYQGHLVSVNQTTCRQQRSDPTVAVHQVLSHPQLDGDTDRMDPLKSLNVPPRTFTPISLQSTLYHQQSFVSLLLPLLDSNQVSSELWRGYVMQRLAWESGSTVTVSGSHPEMRVNKRPQSRQSTPGTDEYSKETAMTNQLLDLLSSWSTWRWSEPDLFETLDEAYLDLMGLLVERRILCKANLRMSRSYIADLRSLGLTFPPITTRLHPFRTKPLPHQERVHLAADEDIDPDIDSCNSVPPTSLDVARNKTISAVCVNRNDGYGGKKQIERFNRGVARYLDIVDELLVVDFNTPRDREPLVELLDKSSRDSDKLTSIVIGPDKCSEFVGEPCEEDLMYEFISKTVGIVAAKGDIILSANCIDTIIPSRRVMHELVRYMPTWRHAVSLRRDHVDESEYRHTHFSYTDVPKNGLKKTDCVSVDKLPSRSSLPLSQVAVWDGVGDFQMAHRKLWKVSGFDTDMHLRGMSDAMANIGWWNNDAVLQFFNVPNLHLKHKRSNDMVWNDFPDMRMKVLDGRPRIVADSNPNEALTYPIDIEKYSLLEQ